MNKRSGPKQGGEGKQGGKQVEGFRENSEGFSQAQRELPGKYIIKSYGARPAPRPPTDNASGGKKASDDS